MLTKSEINKFCDPKMLKIMLVLMMADSSSYTFLNNSDDEESNNKEFIDSYIRILDKWFQSYENSEFDRE
jgi:hypothetical protein